MFTPPFVLSLIHRVCDHQTSPNLTSTSTPSYSNHYATPTLSNPPNNSTIRTASFKPHTIPTPTFASSLTITATSASISSTLMAESTEEQLEALFNYHHVQPFVVVCLDGLCSFSLSLSLSIYIYISLYCDLDRDVSFNKLVGEIPNDITGKNLKFV
ncbi:unnamed protein product [Camellia sinensis]